MVENYIFVGALIVLMMMTMMMMMTVFHTGTRNVILVGSDGLGKRMGNVIVVLPV